MIKYGPAKYDWSIPPAQYDWWDGYQVHTMTDGREWVFYYSWRLVLNRIRRGLITIGEGFKIMVGK